MDLTSKYHLEYFTHNAGGVTKVRFTLRLEDYDISNWRTQGQDGIWLGIGYGGIVMDGADITQCEFKYTNNPNVDKFICNDRYGVAKNAPIYDSLRNTIDISTQVIKKNVSSTVTTATFIATFDRPVNTGDLKDQPLLTGS